MNKHNPVVRFARLFYENAGKMLLFVVVLFGSFYIDILVYLTTGFAWGVPVVTLVSIVLYVLFVPRWTLYGEPLGFWFSGVGYRLVWGGRE